MDYMIKLNKNALTVFFWLFFITLTTMHNTSGYENFGRFLVSCPNLVPKRQYHLRKYITQNGMISIHISINDYPKMISINFFILQGLVQIFYWFLVIRYCIHFLSPIKGLLKITTKYTLQFNPKQTTCLNQFRSQTFDNPSLSINFLTFGPIR